MAASSSSSDAAQRALFMDLVHTRLTDGQLVNAILGEAGADGSVLPPQSVIAHETYGDRDAIKTAMKDLRCVVEKRKRRAALQFVCLSTANHIRMAELLDNEADYLLEERDAEDDAPQIIRENKRHAVEHFHEAERGLTTIASVASYMTLAWHGPTRVDYELADFLKLKEQRNTTEVKLDDLKQTLEAAINDVEQKVNDAIVAVEDSQYDDRDVVSAIAALEKKVDEVKDAIDDQ